MKHLKMGKWFRHYYLQAMGAAIWSCSVETMMRFPAQSFLRFFKNHGLLTINDHPQWYTVKGGSREYVERLSAGFKNNIRLNSRITKVSRSGGSVSIHEENGTITEFDQVIFACHADQALKILDTPDADEKDILGAFEYQDNNVVVHRDTSFMPKTRGSWASWIYLSEAREDRQHVVSLSYWMNNLQPLPTENPVIVTLNPGRRPDSASIVDEHTFSHPVFTVAVLKAQKRIPEIQGRGGIWHTGAYQRYGFHEDGLLSAVTVAGLLGVKPPWS
jgi:predicted NAD/FAD-binding protein